MKLSLTRFERIKTKQEFQSVFSDGKSITYFPVKCLYRNCSNTKVHKIGVAISKKKIKKAARRNLIKRRIKEAYRKNKFLIRDLSPHLIIFNYISSDILSYQEIEHKIILILQRLSEMHNE
ncbi:MAG: ribonuclease P protein component [Bacteroidetes bacterium]|nr:MAG: ribonuclease P protein component [Bacteroidota bacterium]